MAVATTAIGKLIRCTVLALFNGKMVANTVARSRIIYDMASDTTFKTIENKLLRSGYMVL